MRRLTSLLFVGLLVMVLSSAALGAMPEEYLDVKVTVHPHASIDFQETLIQLNLYNNDAESQPGEAFFTIHSNIPINVEVEAKPFFRSLDDDNAYLGYNVAIDRRIQKGLNYGWVPQCSTGSDLNIPNGVFDVEWNRFLDSNTFRATVTAWRASNWWYVPARDYLTQIVFTVSPKN